jgi:hypothetical protein
VLLVLYNDLEADLPAEVRRIAAFLDVSVDDAEALRVARESQLDRMREKALEGEDMLNEFFEAARTASSSRAPTAAGATCSTRTTSRSTRKRSGAC